jgi:hypothetical protein
MTQSSGSVNGWLSSTDWTTFNGKQDALVSGTNIKTVNGTTLLGSGDLGTIGSAYGGTGFSTYATGDLVYASATNTLSKLTAGTNGYVLTLAGGVPTWAAASGGGTTFSPYQFIATASQTTFAVGVTLSIIQVFVSGVLQRPTDDYTISGTNVVLATGVASGTIVSVYVYDTFSVANTYTQSAADALFAPKASPTFTGTLSAATITSSASISDSKGDVRSAPINSQTGAYVLIASDAGKTISITTGGVTVNASVFSAGDMVTIFNNSGSSQNITQGASVTLRLTGTATTGTRALAQYGIATLLCVIGGATPTFACTGSGLT